MLCNTYTKDYADDNNLYETETYYIYEKKYKRKVCKRINFYDCL